MSKLLSTLLLLVIIVSLVCVCGCADNPATKCTPPENGYKVSPLAVVNLNDWYDLGDGSFVKEYFIDGNNTKYILNTAFTNTLKTNVMVKEYKIEYFCNEYGYYQIAKLTPVDDLK